MCSVVVVVAGEGRLGGCPLHWSAYAAAAAAVGSRTTDKSTDLLTDFSK